MELGFSVLINLLKSPNFGIYRAGGSSVEIFVLQSNLETLAFPISKPTASEILSMASFEVSLLKSPPLLLLLT